MTSNPKREITITGRGRTFSNVFNYTFQSRTIITLPGDTKYREVGSLFFDKMHLFYYKAVSKFANQVSFMGNILSRYSNKLKFKLN